MGEITLEIYCDCSVYTVKCGAGRAGILWMVLVLHLCTSPTLLYFLYGMSKQQKLVIKT